MKKIAIVGTPNAAKNYQVVNVTISEQTHRRDQFGNTADAYAFKASNGVELYSSARPEKSAGIKDRFYVRGNDPCQDNAVVEVTPEFYAKLLVAVNEYNEFFKKKEKVVRHITADFAPNPADNYQTVLLTIKKQSHRGVLLADEGSSFKASNGVRLISIYHPEYRHSIPDALYLRGSDSSKDTLVLKIPADKVPAIKEAIKEYNAKYAAPAAPVKTMQIEGEPVAATNYQTVKVTITKQIGVLDDFGTKNPRTTEGGEFIHGKIRLASFRGTAVGFKADKPTKICADKGLVGTFYVCNKITPLGDASLTCEVPVEVYPLIQQAVLAYNKAFGPKVYVERINCANSTEAAIGDVREVLEERGDSYLVASMGYARSTIWYKKNAKVVPAPAANAETVKDGIITVG